MKSSIKACIAYIAGAAITGKKDFTLYDCGKEARVVINGTVADGMVDVKHRKKEYHITGPLNNLRDKKNDIKIEIEIDGKKFKGKDKASGTKFKGKVRDDDIVLTANGYSVYRMD
ncbi:hypothetical protein G8764_14415 [Pseudomaricurvus alcaniphilus]|uniref:hypothetical protein n=1 Tax=Pseudomaricurvus alcaniphilus TaxID=1166482 RepID=UPI001409BA29|nr:hypothetical protein [Pseudomaricurvus alcaniphilus]NHN38498.1 hypothetical protein [Pseudomaricurvus alcaniphilus]